MHTVFVRGLALYAYHGVSDEERRVGHRYLLDISLEVDGSAPESDELDGTVDYAGFGELAAGIVAMSQYRTIEALAARVCDEILRAYGSVQRATVRLEKLLPPASIIADAAGVEVVRFRASDGAGFGKLQ